MRPRTLSWLFTAAALVLASTAVLYGYVGEDVANGGTIRGVVRIEGAPPRLPPHQATTSVEVCGATVPNDEVTVGGGGALANVVVWIDGIERGARPTARRLVLDQRGCRFTPRIASATVGTSLVLTSSDATLHTTHARMGDRSLFNVALPVKGMRVTRRVERAGVVRIGCEAGHTWMRGWLHVFDHPYHAVTGSDGRFELPSLPPGRHRLRAWHERLGEHTATVDVAAGQTATADFRLRAR